MLRDTRLLIVEDDATLAQLLLVHMKKLDCDVMVAETGERALEMCEQAGTPPDVVIMDIKLPGMDGVVCARQIRHRYPDTVIIFLTGVIEESALQRARDITPAAFILKEFATPSAEALRSTIRLALDQRDRGSKLETLKIRQKRPNLIDELTELYNRCGFNTLAPRYLNPGRQAVLFIDLDNLKAINEVHGHEVGNEALRRFAKLLQSTFREDDLIARLSGDEFVVLAAISENTLASAKQRIHQALALANLSGGFAYTLEASVGAVLAKPGIDIKDLLTQADTAMYEEKRLHQSRTAKPPIKDEGTK